jgi:hypothetical protein
MMSELPLIEHADNWICETHGRHSAMMRLHARKGEHEEVRHYCMFCMIDRLDAIGFPQMYEVFEKPEEEKDW